MNTKIFVPIGILIVGISILFSEFHRNEVKKSIDSLNARLNNSDFTAKAPEEIIAKEKERLGSLNKEVTVLEGVLAGLL